MHLNKRSFISTAGRTARLLTILLAMVCLPAVAAAQIFVNQAAGGGNDGSSWANAFTSLQDGLAEARTLAPVEPVEIWVARGVYYPDVGAGLTPNSRVLAFELANNVALYGGFAGNETALNQRDWVANPTVLSGDIDGNDTVDADGLSVHYTDIVGNNSYHVVRGNGLNSSAVLDGFSITGGLANGGSLISIYAQRYGAGLYSHNSSLTLTNLRIQGNWAPPNPNGSQGGGIYFFSDSGRTDQATLTGLQIVNNRADRGGGVHVRRTRVFIEDAVVRDNDADLGGGLYAVLVFVDARNSVFQSNSAIDGGGIWSFRGFVTLVNSLLSGNYATNNGGGYFYDEPTDFPPDGGPQLTNVTISGNRADMLGGGVYRTIGNISRTRLDNTIIWNNQDSSGIGTSSASHGGPGGAKLLAEHSLIQGLNPAGTGNLDGTVPANDPQFISPVDPAAAPTSSGNLRSSPGAATIDQGNNTARINTITGNPPPIPLEGNILFDLDGFDRITDGSGDGVTTVDLGPYELSAADRPIADAGADQTVTSGDLVALDGSASTDPNSLTLTYAWTQSGGQSVTLSDPAAVSPTFTAPFVSGDLLFELIVTNTVGYISDPDTVTLTVELAEYEVIATNVGQGSIMPPSQVVVWDETASFIVTPDSGWSIEQLVGDFCNPTLVSGDDWQATNIQANCSVEARFAINQYPIGGTVSGLSGSGLVLDLNGIEQLPIASNGSFQFATELDHDTSYVVTVNTQPGSPSQGCSVSNGNGTVNAMAVDDIEVSCSINQFTVGGSLSGLAAGNSLILQNNGGDDLVLNANGNFNFATALDDLSSYIVTVLTPPSSPEQTCTVTNASGALAGDNVTDVVVACETDQFTIGGTASGVVGTGLVLQNSGGDDLTITADGAFTFGTALDDLSAYDVAVVTQPNSPSQTCTVANGNGNLAGANVTNVEVTCTTNQFTIGGDVSGLGGTGLVLQNNSGDDLAITADGTFTFATALDDLSAYDVAVLSQPTAPIQTCTVSNGSDTLAGANATDVMVNCLNDPPEVDLSTNVLDFSLVLEGNSATESVTLTNTGTGELIISEMVEPNAPFSVTGGSCMALPVTLLPGESCDIEVTFMPAGSTGGFGDELTIVSNAASSPDTVTLSGNGQSPIPVPGLDRFGLLLLMLLMAGVAWCVGRPTAG